MAQNPKYVASRLEVKSNHELWLLGAHKLGIHLEAACAGRNCSVHNPSDTPMVSMALNWRAARGMMERVCEHGVGHPDPDDAAYRASQGNTDTVHGCDGCCA